MNRCACCRVKTLMEYPCRFCFKIHCLKHRTPEDHACAGDLKEAVKLETVEAAKVDKI